MEYRKLKDMKKLAGNPRTIKNKEFETLRKSIRDNPEYFEARPLILSNRTGDLVIIAGNQRYEAAKAEKLDRVPTFLIEGLTAEKEREIIIRDNISNGEWDMVVLQEWKDLPLEDWGLFVKDPVDIEKMITSEEEYIEAQKTAEQAIEAMSQKIKTIAERHPKRLNGSMAVVVTNGRGNDVLFLSDPNTSDIVKELQRLSEQGEKSPLDVLIRQLDENSH